MILCGQQVNMKSLQLTAKLVVLALLWASVTTALKTQVLSTVIFTRHGERTPFVLSDSPTLTSLGAKQMYDAGSLIREMYVDPSTNGTGMQIRNISPHLLVNSDLNIVSTTDEWVVSSAQAFMQGLYPPLLSGGNITYLDGSSVMANGSLLIGPDEDMQYPRILTAPISDVSSIWVRGASGCPAYRNAMMDYYDTSQYQTLVNRSQPFYDGIHADYLSKAFDQASTGFFNAYYIWDYIQYEYIHNGSFADSFAAEDLVRARTYSDDWVYAMYANTSADGEIGGNHLLAIAGRTLINRILQSFYNSINTAGQYNKMSLMFGNHVPMVSFAALVGLITPQNSAFYNTPGPGASYIFELFSMEADNETSQYPSTTDMFVRFLYHNGVDNQSTLVEYPLFGHSPSQSVMSFLDFSSTVERLMINDVADWCNTCQSNSLFCPAFTGKSLLASDSNQHGKLSAAIGGVIGAFTALVFASLLAAVAIFCGGVRVHRVSHKRRSDLGGFKGAEKLASDLDLTVPKGGAAAVVSEAGAEESRGHERVGSWELREQAKDIEASPVGLDMRSSVGRRASYEDDEIHVNPFTAPVRTRDQI